MQQRVVHPPTPARQPSPPRAVRARLRGEVGLPDSAGLAAVEPLPAGRTVRLGVATLVVAVGDPLIVGLLAVERLTHARLQVVVGRFLG